MRKDFGKKIVICIMAALVLQLGLAFEAAASTAKKPVIKVYSDSACTITVKTSSASAHAGFQIKYSKAKPFRAIKTLNVKTKGKLNKKITRLTAGRTVYVKVRSYRLGKNKQKVWSAWSTVKPVTVKKPPVYSTCYVNGWKINLEKSKKSTNKYKIDPAKYTLPYMAKVQVYDYKSKYKSNAWVKLKYGGKVYYTYVMHEKEPAPFTKTQHKFEYDTYEGFCKNDVQRAIVSRALEIYNSGILKSYDNEHVTYKIEMGDDVTKLDCINLARFIINPVLGANVVPPNSMTLYEAGQNNSFIEKNGKKFLAKGVSKVSALQPGDIICLHESGDKVVNHVAVYLGNHDLIEIAGSIPGSNTGGAVIEPMRTRYVRNFVSAVRFIEAPSVE